MEDSGTVRKMHSYLLHGMKETPIQAFVLGVLTILILGPFLYTGEEFAVLAVAGFGGLLAMLVGSATVEGSTRLSDLEEPPIARWAISVVIVMYLNVMLFLSVALGLGIYYAGFPSLAIIVSVLIPAIDYELSLRGFPLVTALANLLIVLIQKGVRVYELLIGKHGWSDGLQAARKYVDRSEKAYQIYFSRVRLSTSPWL